MSLALAGDVPDRPDVIEWAGQWIEHWNARNVEAMLARYRDDVRFESPMAEAVTGSPVVEGKTALRQYWNAVLARIRVLHFELERVIWDPHLRELAIVYVLELDGQRTRSCEVMTLDAVGQIIRGDACYGAALECRDRGHSCREDATCW